jgi:hypothetical protein
MTTETVTGVVVDHEDGSPPSIVVELPTTAETEALPGDAVAIAEIEANRDITIAAIHSDTEVQRAEAYAEVETAAVENREDLEWRMNHLTSLVETMSLQLATLTVPALEVPLPSSEEVTEAIAEEVAETLEATSSIPNSTSGQTSETLTEATDVSASPEVLEVPPLLEVGRKRIIRLV